MNYKTLENFTKSYNQFINVLHKNYQS